MECLLQASTWIPTRSSLGIDEEASSQESIARESGERSPWLPGNVTLAGGIFVDCYWISIRNPDEARSYDSVATDPWGKLTHWMSGNGILTAGFLVAS